MDPNSPILIRSFLCSGLETKGILKNAESRSLLCSPKSPARALSTVLVAARQPVEKCRCTQLCVLTLCKLSELLYLFSVFHILCCKTETSGSMYSQGVQGVRFLHSVVSSELGFHELLPWGTAMTPFPAPAISRCVQRP